MKPSWCARSLLGVHGRENSVPCCITREVALSLISFVHTCCLLKAGDSLKRRDNVGSCLSGNSKAQCFRQPKKRGENIRP